MIKRTWDMGGGRMKTKKKQINKEGTTVSGDKKGEGKKSQKRKKKDGEKKKTKT